MTKLFQQLNQQQTPMANQLPSLKNNLSILQNMMKNSNPTSIIQNLMMNNPRVKQIMDAYNSSGMTPKQFFYQYTQQNGIDPNNFLNS